MNSTAYIIAALITAHFAGDFLFQTKKDVKKKNEAKFFIKHILVITGLSYLLLGNWVMWQIPIFILITHALLDQVKLRVLEKNFRNFIFDQLLHLLVIITLAYYYQDEIDVEKVFWIKSFGIAYLRILFLTLALILITKFSSICIGMIVKSFQEKLKQDKDEQIRHLDVGSGKMIGYLERFLILILILSSNAAGIGFLITAKSILRFSEIKNSRDRLEVEYILIGTLLSFSFGITIALGTNYILGQLS